MPLPTFKDPRVYIIVLNWNGWRDTVECLESLFRIQYSNFCVIVCDNSSSDGSIEQICRWAQGEVPAGCGNYALLALTTPPVPKPIPYDVFESPQATGALNGEIKLVVIGTGANLGYAGGNNVGLRYALGCGDMDYAWLLNNDTVVRPDALTTLVRRMQERPDAGICGSTLLYYHDPSKVQALGGAAYNRWTARGKHIGMLCDAGHLPSSEAVELKMKYVVGASALVSRAFIDSVGLMDETYFLYFEEIDWATRASKEFRLAYSQESIIYHKDGATTGSSSASQKRTVLSERLATRNRLLFTRRYYPLALATVWLAVLASACQRLLTGKIGHAVAMLQESFGMGKVFRINRQGEKRAK